MRFRRLYTFLLCLVMMCLATNASAEQWLFSAELLEIKDEAFSGCTQITEAVFPDGLTTIGEGAFQNCSQLQRVVLPASVVTIGNQAFDGCAEALYFVCEPGTLGAAWAASNGFDWDAGTVCRALIIGESYTGTSISLKGPANDLKAMAACLRQMRTRAYTVTEEKNLTADGILAAIDAVFGAATVNDISLLYYSGHGAEDGYLVGQDLQYVSPDALRNALDRIPGRKVVIVDACYSGALLEDESKGTTRDNKSPLQSFSQGFTSAFYTNTRSLKGSSYYVMTACQATETCSEGYIRSGAAGRDMGFFTYSLCMGCGWDGVQRVTGSLLADQNGNGVVTFAEAYIYASSKARIKNPNQSAMVYPSRCTWFSPFRP